MDEPCPVCGLYNEHGLFCWKGPSSYPITAIEVLDGLEAILPEGDGSRRPIRGRGTVPE